MSNKKRIILVIATVFISIAFVAIVIKMEEYTKRYNDSLPKIGGE